MVEDIEREEEGEGVKVKTKENTKNTKQNKTKQNKIKQNRNFRENGKLKRQELSKTTTG